MLQWLWGQKIHLFKGKLYIIRYFLVEIKLH